MEPLACRDWTFSSALRPPTASIHFSTRAVGEGAALEVRAVSTRVHTVRRMG